MLKTTKDKKGWLFPYLVSLDLMFYKRWDYWLKVCKSNRVPDDPIPYIKFQPIHEYPKKEVQKNLKDCLKEATYQLSHPLDSFVDWILWGFNYGKEFPVGVTDKIDDYWYRTFNLGLFYREPADHWPDLAMDVMGRNNPLGFFATPGAVVDMMVQMNFGGKPENHHKLKSVLDPCCGTGGMLLYASNYSLNLYGQDISKLLTKMAIVNAFIYMPWMVFKPKHLSIFDVQITEKEFPSGIKIPVCTKCEDQDQSFFMDLKTDYLCEVSNAGHFTLDTPTISSDLIKRKLVPENIGCAKCKNKEKEEAL
jgi:N-6 DNA Methylase